MSNFDGCCYIKLTEGHLIVHHHCQDLLVRWKARCLRPSPRGHGIRSFDWSVVPTGRSLPSTDSATEDAAKDSRDRPTEDVIIVDSGEVSAVSTLGLR